MQPLPVGKIAAGTLGRRTTLLHLSGLPLSVPAACGLYEIFHLKCSLYYYSSIIAGLSPLVKDRFIPNQTIPILFVNLHKSND